VAAPVPVPFELAAGTVPVAAAPPGCCALGVTFVMFAATNVAELIGAAAGMVPEEPLVDVLFVDVDEVPFETSKEFPARIGTPAAFTTLTALKLVRVAAACFNCAIATLLFVPDVSSRSCVYLCVFGALLGGEGPKYGANAVSLFALLSTKTIIPPIIVAVVAEVRPCCIQ